jgi:inner membrane protein
MDSLTQIVLGAAVGEAVLGKKIGNRAIIWGGIAGTIPDLDVLGNLFMSPVEALAFHRGITHALIFSLVAGPIFAWLTHQFYKQNIYQQQTYKTTISALLIMVFTGLFGSIIYFSWSNENPPIILILLAIGASGFLFRRIWKYWRYPVAGVDLSSVSMKDWSLFFGLGFLTHTLLDACTPFGTQLFEPFSNVRISFDTIAVVDPIYTVPFLICLIITAFYHKSNRKRQIFNWIGIGLSSAYLLFTFYNQNVMQHKFEDLLKDRNIAYNRASVVPTIFNNALWQCVAETDSNYLFTNYSIFDEDLDKIELVQIEKNHELLEPYHGDKEVEILRWFSKGYYNIEKNPNGSLTYNDLKMAVIPEDIMGELTFGMNFIISESGSGIMIEDNREPPNLPEGAFGRFWERIKGFR